MTPERIPEEEYQKQIVEKCEQNHIWLNKAVYLSPTNDAKIKLADMILAKLNHKSTQIPASGITCETDTVRELAELTPMLYLSVNWS